MLAFPQTAGTLSSPPPPCSEIVSVTARYDNSSASADTHNCPPVPAKRTKTRPQPHRETSVSSTDDNRQPKMDQPKSERNVVFDSTKIKTTPVKNFLDITNNSTNKLNDNKLSTSNIQNTDRGTSVTNISSLNRLTEDSSPTRQTQLVNISLTSHQLGNKISDDQNHKISSSITSKEYRNLSNAINNTQNYLSSSNITNGSEPFSSGMPDFRLSDRKSVV